MKNSGALVTLCCVLLAAFASASTNIPAARLVQYDQEGQQKGSRRATFSMPAMEYVKENDLDLTRTAIYVRWDQLSVDDIQHIVEEEEAGAVVIVLPAAGSHVNVKQSAQWRNVESWLLANRIPMPVFFAFDGPWAENLQKSIRSGKSPVISGTSPTPKVVTAGKARNFQAVISTPTSSNTVAILTPWDSFAAAPSLANGEDSNASGVAALLEISRLFHELYSQQGGAGSADILFVMTAASKLNYAGTKHWLANTDGRLLDTITAVICLESLAGNGPLRLISSKPRSDSMTESMAAAFEQSASAAGEKVHFSHLKVNVSNTATPWEHEAAAIAFRGKKVATATFTRIAVDGLRARSTLIPAVASVAKLKSATQVLAGAIAHMVYGAAGSKVEPTLHPNTDSLSSAMEALSATPRVAALLEASPAGFEFACQKLSNYSTKAQRQTFAVESNVQFYTDSMGSLSIALPGPTWLEPALSIGITAYCFCLLVAFKGVGGAIKLISSLFSSKAKSS